MHDKLQKYIVYFAITAVTLLMIHVSNAQNPWFDTAYASLLKESSLTSTIPLTNSNQPLPPDAVRVPILVYHNIHPPYPGESETIRKVTTSPDLLDREMQYLRASGFNVIPFGVLEKCLNGGKPLPFKPIIISFDDGWEDQFTYAFPILKKYGYRATFFVITNYVGHRDFLSWVQLRQLASAGMTIGSHSRSHQFLNRIIDPSMLDAEISGSKRLIEWQLGTTIKEFAYPYGAFNQRVIALVKNAGYQSARADHPGIWHSKSDQYILSAINVPPDFNTFKKGLSTNSWARQLIN